MIHTVTRKQSLRICGKRKRIFGVFRFHPIDALFHRMRKHAIGTAHITIGYGKRKIRCEFISLHPLPSSSIGRKRKKSVVSIFAERQRKFLEISRVCKYKFTFFFVFLDRRRKCLGKVATRKSCRDRDVGEKRLSVEKKIGFAVTENKIETVHC